MEEFSSFAKVTSTGFCDKDEDDILVKAQIFSCSYKQKLKNNRKPNYLYKERVKFRIE